MFANFSRGWDLMKQSWGVLKQDKELLIFPVLSGLACLLVLASFFVPIAMAPAQFGEWMDAAFNTEQSDPVKATIGIALLFLFYFLNYFVIVFFNCALVSCAIIRFKGGDPTLSDGLRSAGSRLPQIAGWALLAATVGLILRMLEERFEAVGRFIIGLIGAAWSIVTFLVVPVLTVERTGPFTALKRSAVLLKQTWGESLAGNFSMGLINFLLAIPGFLLIVGGVYFGVNNESLTLALAMVIPGILYLLALSLVISALKQIFVAGIYIYASEGQVPNGFSNDAIQGAFSPKGN